MYYFSILICMPNSLQVTLLNNKPITPIFLYLISVMETLHAKFVHALG